VIGACRHCCDHAYDAAAAALACTRRRNDVTRYNCIDRHAPIIPIWSIMCRHVVIHKAEEHDVSQRCHMRTEPRSQVTHNLVKIGYVVPETCSRTDNTQTDRQTRSSQYSATSNSGGVTSFEFKTDTVKRVQSEFKVAFFGPVLLDQWMWMPCYVTIGDCLAAAGRHVDVIKSLRLSSSSFPVKYSISDYCAVCWLFDWYICYCCV